MFNFFKKNPAIQNAINNCKNQAENLSHNIELTSPGKYEALMLGSFMTMMHSKFDASLRKDLMRAVIKEANNYNTGKTHNELTDLINERMQFYNSVLNEIKEGNSMALGSLYNVLIENPLTKKPIQSFNLLGISKLQITIRNFFHSF